MQQLSRKNMSWNPITLKQFGKRSFSAQCGTFPLVVQRALLSSLLPKRARDQQMQPTRDVKQGRRAARHVLPSQCQCKYRCCQWTQKGEWSDRRLLICPCSPEEFLVLTFLFIPVICRCWFGIPQVRRSSNNLVSYCLNGYTDLHKKHKEQRQGFCEKFNN